MNLTCLHVLKLCILNYIFCKPICFIYLVLGIVNNPVCLNSLPNLTELIIKLK